MNPRKPARQPQPTKPLSPQLSQQAPTPESPHTQVSQHHTALAPPLPTCSMGPSSSGFAITARRSICICGVPLKASRAPPPPPPPPPPAAAPPAPPPPPPPPNISKAWGAGGPPAAGGAAPPAAGAGAASPAAGAAPPAAGGAAPPAAPASARCAADSGMPARPRRATAVDRDFRERRVSVCERERGRIQRVRALSAGGRRSASSASSQHC